MKYYIINHRRYTVNPVFNMVLNYEFTDKDGVIYLVDAEDIGEFTDGASTSTIDAVKYAKHYASQSEDGIFWWKIKT